MDLFSTTESDATEPEWLGAGLARLSGFATAKGPAIVAAMESVERTASWRTMKTPGGRSMSVETTNAGEAGWYTDRQGYRYSPVDPLTGRPWPSIPPVLNELAHTAAQAAGFDDFYPDACLVNRYWPGSRMGLHQDRDEADMTQPIVSVSLGLPATFLWGGMSRGGSPNRMPLIHGDVLVWGREDRLRFHGVAPVKNGPLPEVVRDYWPFGECRINLTFRRAL